MKLILTFSIILGTSIFGIAALLWKVGNAIELVDGTTHFLNPPRFLGARASQNGTYVWGATYYFTIALPDNAGEALQKVVITQESGFSRPLFDIKNVEVFEGEHGRLGHPLPIQKVILNSDSLMLTVLFEPPIPPGKTMTIRLYPVRNPSVAGTYLYGVTAFPVGERPYGQFIGVGQIQIYDSNLE
jgi:hypothetical protein